MCKLLMMAGLNPSKQELAWKFAKLMAEIMTEHNDDGLGYAAVDPQGNLFGERWLFNEEAFTHRNRFTKPVKMDKKKLEALKKEFGDFLNIEAENEVPAIEKYGSFGTLTNKISAITLHARAASNTVCYENTHPFVDLEKSISVIHNGFIGNHVKEDEIRSTCDSERILNQYIEHELNKIPADVQNFIDSLTGSFACGIFAKDKNNKRVLDIFRTRRPLGMVYVHELGTFVYSTSIKDVTDACKYLKWNIGTKPDLIKEDRLFRLDAITGKPILSIDYKDTTLRDRTDFRGARTPTSNAGTVEQYHKNWEEAARKERERKSGASNPGTNSGGSEKANTLTLIEGGRRYTDSEKQEIEDLKKAGFDQADIDEYFKRGDEGDRDYKEEEIKHLMTENGWDRKSAESFVENQIRSANVANELKDAKAIVEQAFKEDKLNTTEAANDGWAYSTQEGLWSLRKNTKH